MMRTVINLLAENLNSQTHQLGILGDFSRHLHLLGLLEFRVVLQPGPSLDVRVGVGRFGCNHIQPRISNASGFADGRRFQWALSIGSILPDTAKAFRVISTAKDRSVSILWVGQEGCRLGHQCIELIALGQESREILFVRDEIRQPGGKCGHDS